MASIPWAEVRARLGRAIRRVTSEDAYILENQHHEQTVAHRLAVHLGREFRRWNVDCEYNRAGGRRDPKKIGLPSGRKKIVRPDIVVHHRGVGPKGQNLLAVEIKPVTRAPDSLKEDRYKLRRYLVDHDYEYAVLLTYRTTPPIGFEPIERIRPDKN